MASRVIWTATALRGLRDAVEYIAADSRRSARALNDYADSVARSLQESPSRGRVVPEFRDESVREVFVKSYRLVYVVRPSRVLIIRFIHGARDLSADSTIYSQT